MLRKNKTERHPVNSRILLMIVSLFAAVVVWLIFTMTAFPEISVTVKNVPIDYSLDGTYADVVGLSIVGETKSTVNVKLTGLRYVVGDYNADDIKVVPNFDSVRASGIYELSLNVMSVNGDNIVVDQVEPGTVHAEFDYYVTKSFSVEDGTLSADLSMAYAESGYILDADDVTITPSQITVSGPKDYVDQITSCVVVLNDNVGLKESYSTANTSVKLYSGDALYDNSRVTVDNESINIKIPVYMKKLLNLDVEVQTYFDQFDISTLSYSVSPQSIIVRSQNSAIENLSEIFLGYIDLRQVTVDSVFVFDIAESPYYSNVSGVESATVTFNLDGYATKNVTIPNSQIYVVNVPDGYRAVVETEKIRNVTIVGPKDVIDKIDASDVVAHIDLLDYNVSAGDFLMTATIYLPNYNTAWANGSHKVYCFIEEITDDATNE